MTKTIWGRQRKAATEAGAYHAQGGPDRRAYFASLGRDTRDAYDKGFQNETTEQNLRDERSRHPLRQISAAAYRIRSNPDPEVSELARLVEELTDYILEKEES